MVLKQDMRLKNLEERHSLSAELESLTLQVQRAEADALETADCRQRVEDDMAEISRQSGDKERELLVRTRTVDLLPDAEASMKSLQVGIPVIA